MKCLIIGGNRFVGLRLSLLLEKIPGIDLHILNRTGQAPHCKSATVHKGDRRGLSFHALDQDWDVIYDFACFTQEDAESALRFFKKVGRYIFISSASIYDSGKDLAEKSFVASSFDLTQPHATDPELLYQDGKRRAEAVFASQTRIPVVSVRFPFILGLDDYTRRLEFHIERIQQRKPMYVPNSASEISFVDSTDAAKFLAWSAEQDFYGAINVASPNSLSLRGLIAQIETLIGTEAILAAKPSEDNHSPYGIPSDHSLDAQELASLGFTCRKLNDWLPELIRSHVGAKVNSNLH